VLSPVMPQEYNLAAFLLDPYLSEGRAHKPTVYCDQETITDAAKRVGNVLLNVGVELENRVMICPARRAVKCKGISWGEKGAPWRSAKLCQVGGNP